MAIKTFDSNRVGGGTFQLKQDPTTGEYTVEEVGFVKLPELKLPEIDQAPFKLPETKPDDPTTDTPVDVGGVQTGGGGSGGGGQDQTFTDFDYTGTKEYQNIQKEATKFAKQDTGIDRTSMDQGAIKVEDIRSLESMPKAYQNLVNEYNRHQADVQQRNMTGSVDEEQALSDLMYSRELRNQINEMKGTSFVTKEGSTVTAGRADPEIIKAAPEIADFSKGPITVPPGTLTGGTTPIDQGTFTKESIDKSFLGEEGTDENVFKKAKDVVSNSKPVQLIGVGIRMAGKVLTDLTTSPQQQALNTSNKNALSSLGYKTRGELGGSTDPGRIAGNPADNVFAGMNAQSARGNVMTGSANRIKTRETVGIQRVEARYGKDSQQAKDFRAKTETFKDQRQEVLDAKEKEQAKINQQTMNQGPAGQDPGADKQGCVIATHAVNSGAFTADTKREAVRWCVKNLHKTWWGEAIRRGYRYYGQKAIDEGKAKNHYQEFKDYVAFGTGKRRTLKTAWTFTYRTIQFFVKGLFSAKR